MIVKKTIIKKGTSVKDLLFKRFKKSVGMTVFMIKFNGEKEKTMYNDVLTELKSANYLNYTVSFSGIQIFLTDLGRKTADEEESW